MIREIQTISGETGFHRTFLLQNLCLYISHVDSFCVEKSKKIIWRGLLFICKYVFFFWKVLGKKSKTPFILTMVISTHHCSKHSTLLCLWRQRRRRRRTCHGGGRRARCRWGRCCRHLGGSFSSTNLASPKSNQKSPRHLDFPTSS